MSTSPDDLTSVPPPGMTTFVIPTPLAREVAEFLTARGMTVAKHPSVPDEHTFIAVPSADIVKALSDVSGRYRIVYDEDGTFGTRARVVDTRATVETKSDSTMWVPVSSEPGLRPLQNPHTLPAYVTRANVGGDDTCVRCSHRHVEHTGYAYRPPLSGVTSADITVVICDGTGCSCLTRLAPPTPV